jgi:hypothetical protein
MEVIRQQFCGDDGIAVKVLRQEIVYSYFDSSKLENLDNDAEP